MRTDVHGDPVLTALQELHTYDVSAVRARRLRRRCHGRLKMRHASGQLPWRNLVDLRQRAMAACAAAWCVLYMLETLRQAATVYGLWRL